MMGKRLRSLLKDQRGLTLVEVLIAFLLAGIVTAGITVTMGHLLTGSTRTSNHMTAVRQVQSAGYWVSRDALQAQRVVLLQPDPEDQYPPNSGFPIRFEWEWDDKDTSVEYSITLDNRLLRTRTVHDTLGDVTSQESTYVSQHIDITLDDDLKPSTRFTPGAVLALRVTATVGGQSETRVYDVTPRPDAPDDDD